MTTAAALVQRPPRKNCFNLLRGGADLFGEIGNLVDESDLGGEEGVGGIFDRFRGAPRGEHR
jgi:hypothetical protein